MVGVRQVFTIGQNWVSEDEFFVEGAAVSFCTEGSIILANLRPR